MQLIQLRSAKEYIAVIEKKYFINIEFDEGNNQFVKWVFTIHDPNRRGLSIQLSFNDKEELSAVDTLLFPFDLTIAEQSEEKLKSCVEGILNGNFEIEKSFLKSRLCVDINQHKICSQRVKLTNEEREFIGKYTLKEEI